MFLYTGAAQNRRVFPQDKVHFVQKTLAFSQNTALEPQDRLFRKILDISPVKKGPIKPLTDCRQSQS